jgi:hypothetical protein
MRFVRLFFVLNLSFIALGACAQTEKKYAVIAKLSPLALFDPNTAVAQSGLEVRLGQNWGLQAEYGLQANLFAKADRNKKTENRYNKWRSELRYYLANKKAAAANGEQLIALEVFGVQQQYQKRDGRFVDLKNQYEKSFDTATVHRRTKGFCIKFGYVFTTSKNGRMMMELSGGLGLRLLNIHYSAAANLQAYDPGVGIFILNAFRIRANDEFEGNKTRPHLAATAKICYRLF